MIFIVCNNLNLIMPEALSPMPVHPVITFAPAYPMPAYPNTPATRRSPIALPVLVFAAHNYPLTPYPNIIGPWLRRSHYYRVCRSCNHSGSAAFCACDCNKQNNNDEHFFHSIQFKKLKTNSFQSHIFNTALTK